MSGPFGPPQGTNSSAQQSGDDANKFVQSQTAGLQNGSISPADAWKNMKGQSGAGGILGNAAAGGVPQYGGYAGGANDAANYAANLGQGYANRAAPTIDNTYTNQMRAQRYGDYAQQGQALGLLGAAARGDGPSAAQAQFGHNLSQSIQAQQAGANSTRGGGANLATAQRGAAFQGAATADAGAQQAAALRAQEMQAAQGAYMQGSLGMGGQNLQAQGQEFGQGLSAAQLAQQQMQLNQTGQTNALTLGYGAMGDQLTADTSRYGANIAAQTAKAKQDEQNQQDTFANVGHIVAGAAGTIAGGPAGGVAAYKATGG